MSEVKIIQERYNIINREKELESAIAAVRAGKHIFFEGIVGVGKTVIANALARYFSKNFYRVDGDERYTGNKLVGWFDPALVLAKGYSWETFIPGPLTQAMMEGAFLFINELNRMPEGTQNVLLPAMDERQIIIPKIGVVEAKQGFLIIATQNPEEFVGTSRLGEALKDRFIWIRLEYQTEDEEKRIVKKETRCRREDIIELAVKIARTTRNDPEIRRGASVRGAIDMVVLVQQLSKSSLDLATWTKAAIMALATKIELRDEATKKVEEVIQRIVASALETSENLNKKKDDINKKEKKKPSLEEIKNKRVLKAALNRGNLDEVIVLLQQNPKSISQILCEEGIFETMLQAVERSEAKLPALRLLYLAQADMDPTRKLVARKILTRIILHLSARIAASGVGPIEQFNVPYELGLEEFDLDETLENKLGKKYLDSQDIVCIENRRKKKAISLMLDTSNSMQREKIVFAALAVGVFAHKLRDDYYSIITFSDNAKLLKPFEKIPILEKIINDILDLQPEGITDIKAALEKGLEELGNVQIQERIGILITDGWVTKGGNPLETAQKYPKLHVIQVPLGVGGGDSETCSILAKAGKGKHSYVQNFQNLPQAIMTILR